MKAYIGITDSQWFDYLSSLHAFNPLDELNFWRPSGSDAFRALDDGELFLFKLHAPDNYIVGGGFFEHFTKLPYRMAWDFFAEKNGATTLPEMRHRIEKYRRAPSDPGEDYVIGCIILSAPFFLDRSEWITVPEDWSRHIQRGKTYDLRDGLGAELWREVQLRLQAIDLSTDGEMRVADRPDKSTRDRELPFAAKARQLDGPMWSEPIPTRHRLGQGGFKSKITDTYQRRCAITQEKALPVLEAAHILPVSEGGQHLIANGMLLRSDLHRLFDRGYVTVTPKHRVRVSKRLKEDFDNGEPYYPFEGSDIWLPRDEALRPGKEFLEWHEATIFRR